MSILDISTNMASIKARIDELGKEKTELQKEFDQIRKVDLPDAMEDAGIESVRIAGVGTVSLRTDAYVTIRSGVKVEAYGWLAEQGYGDLVTDYVQPSTLKAFMKEQTKQGVVFPEEFFSFTPYTYATITGAKK